MERYCYFPRLKIAGHEKVEIEISESVNGDWMNDKWMNDKCRDKFMKVSDNDDKMWTHFV